MLDSEYPNSGFSFDNVVRNTALLQKGYKLPLTTSTGTTIVGCLFKDGLVLGADTRATEGPIVADKNCEKIHYLSDNIYCCGAGTAADTEFTTALISSKLELHRFATGRQSRVVIAMTLLKQMLYKYQGHIGAALILGGYDINGPQLYTIYPHGSTDKLPFVTMGSGSLNAMAIFEAKWKKDLDRNSAIELVSEAIQAGIFNDLGSGSNVDVTVITKNETTVLRNYCKPNERGVKEQAYTFSPGTTKISQHFCVLSVKESHKKMVKRKTHLKSSLKSLLASINSYSEKGRILTEIFATLPDKNEYPDYYTVIKNPIALDMINDKIDDNSYADFAQMYQDLVLMLDNAKIYNRKGSIVYKDAVTLGGVVDEYFQKEGFASPKKGKEGKNELAKILNKLWESSLSELFKELPDKGIYPDYYQEIKNPIALSMIRDKIDSITVEEMESDLKLMVANAKQYNAEGSDVVTDAEFLLKLFYESSGLAQKGKDLVKVLQVGEHKVESFKVNREVYRIGDCVFLKNAIDPSKPIIGQIYDIWAYKSGGTADGLTVCWFLYPEQTVHKVSTKFMEKEVLKSNQFVNYDVKDVTGKCWILQTKDYLKGRPKDATFDNTFVCESRYNDQAKNISKIKNWLSAVPEAVRGVEPVLELFDTPLVPVKVLSSIAESLVVKKETDEVYDDEDMDVEEDEEEEPEPSEKRGRPRRSAAAANPVASTPVAVQEKKIVFSPGLVRPQAPPAPAGPQLEVAANPYLGVAGYSTSLPTTGGGPSSAFGRPVQNPSGPTNQINPLYYNQLGNLPGDNINESTAESFDRLPDGRIKWFAGPPLDVIDDEEPIHSVEYLLKRAKEPIQATNKKASRKTKEEPSATGLQTENQDSEVDWNPLTQTLQELASIWLKDASLVSS